VEAVTLKESDYFKMNKKIPLRRKIFELSPRVLKNIYYQITFFLWKLRDKPIPPPHVVKQKILEEYKKKYDIQILIETGTFRGDMIYAHLKTFKKIYSIELDKYLWKEAVKRFKKQEHVKIIQGDSGKILKDLIKEIKERSIFWLDGHYSGGITAKGDTESPILEELNTILSSKKDHIILIDDAREFTGKRGYPTIEALKKIIFKEKPGSQIKIQDDVIRIVLRGKRNE
jgi:hypothetical protein